MSNGHTTKQPTPRESEVQRAILTYLKLAGILAWRANCGAVTAEHNGKRRYVKFGVPGQADIHALLSPAFGPRAGTFVGIEVKRRGQRPSPAQVSWLQAVNRVGGVAFWTSRADLVADLLEAIRRNPALRIEMANDGSMELTDE